MAVTTDIRENERIARRFPEEVATGGDVDLIDEICAEDVVDHGPMGDLRGREEIKERVEYLRTAFRDFSATVEDAVAEGDTVAMRVILRGTHEGEYMGIGPTGNEMEAWNTVFTRIEDGLIVERWVQPDLLTIMHQLGAIEAPDL